MKQEKKESVIKQTLGIYWHATKKFKWYALSSSVLLLAGVIINSNLGPYFVSEILNRIQGGVPAGQLLEVFLPYLLWAGGLLILSELVLWRAGIWLLWKQEVLVQKHLYEMAFLALVKQSISFHNNKMSGALSSHARNFSNSYANFYDVLVFYVMRIVVAIVAILVVLTPIMPLYTAVLFVLMLAFIAVASLGLGKVSAAQIKKSKEFSKLSGIFADSISNIQAVKSNGREDFEIEEIAKQGKIAAAAELNFAKKITLRDMGFGAILSASNILILVIAVFGQNWFSISVGTLTLVMTYSRQLVNQLWDINRIFRGFSQAFGDADETVRILLQSNSVKDEKDAPNLQVSGGKIEFRDVDFRHEDKKYSLFTDFNLKIKAGEKIGLVGASGSGKSTLTKMILRFSDVESGEILIDGQNIAKVSQSSLRKNIAYVPQESVLFARTIAENIAYGRPDATEKEIIAAAKLANAWDFIKELPEGLQTKTGERGTQLSGGQRQRISIARAILKDSPILILDEATSALDTESEKLIQDALENLMKNRTSIVIAHRLSTIQQMDRIIVIEDGEIVEQGTHEQLLTLDAKYAKLWKIQSGEA